MKLLLDQGLPRSAATILRASGVDTTHVREIGLAAADDAAILEYGRQEGCVVVILDADFYMLMAISEAAGPSVIRIRIEGLRGEALAQLLLEVLQKCAAELEAGSLVSVRTNRLKLRKLPLFP